MAEPGGPPDDAVGRDPQYARLRQRNYGVIAQDPDEPLEGWTWLRKDLSPPQLRVRLGTTVFAVDLTAI